jgi:hypothetical protein
VSFDDAGARIEGFAEIPEQVSTFPQSPGNGACRHLAALYFVAM